MSLFKKWSVLFLFLLLNFTRIFRTRLLTVRDLMFAGEIKSYNCNVNCIETTTTSEHRGGAVLL